MTNPETSTANNKTPELIWAVTWHQTHWGKYTRGAWSYTPVKNYTSYTRTDIHDTVVAERDDLRLANNHADAVIDQLQTALNALDSLLIALSTGKGIAEATDAAKAVMRRATQGDTL